MNDSCHWNVKTPGFPHKQLDRKYFYPTLLFKRGLNITIWYVFLSITIANRKHALRHASNSNWKCNQDFEMQYGYSLHKIVLFKIANVLRWSQYHYYILVKCTPDMIFLNEQVNQGAIAISLVKILCEERAMTPHNRAHSNNHKLVKGSNPQAL